MNHYLVTWEIDIDAASCEEAAGLALAIQRNRHSSATVFEVKDLQTGSTTTVDLEDKE